MRNKIIKAMTLTEIVAITLASGFIAYRTYQAVSHPYEFKFVEQSLTNSPYLNAIYDSRENLK